MKGFCWQHNVIKERWSFNTQARCLTLNPFFIGAQMGILNGCVKFIGFNPALFKNLLKFVEGGGERLIGKTQPQHPGLARRNISPVKGCDFRAYPGRVNRRPSLEMICDI